MSKRKTEQTEDDIFNSIYRPEETKQNRIDSKIALDSLRPQYDSNSIPLEVGRGNQHTRFDHTAIDYSRERLNLTEDEVFDSVMNPRKRISRGNRGAMKDISANVSPEVREYWLRKIQGSEIRRGKLYGKL